VTLSKAVHRPPNRGNSSSSGVSSPRGRFKTPFSTDYYESPSHHRTIPRSHDRPNPPLTRYHRGEREDFFMASVQVSVSVVVFQEDEYVCAQCLEYDIAAQAKTLDDCLYEFGRLLTGHVAISLENNLEPFHGIPRAPARFWEWFERSKIPLVAPTFNAEALTRRGVVVDPPQIRVAQPQAA